MVVAIKGNCSQKTPYVESFSVTWPLTIKKELWQPLEEKDYALTCSH